jgi:hypothetical protein
LTVLNLSFSRPVNVPTRTSHFGYAWFDCWLQALAGQGKDFRDRVTLTFRAVLRRVTKVSAAGWFVEVGIGGVLLTLSRNE